MARTAPRLAQVRRLSGHHARSRPGQPRTHRHAHRQSEDVDGAILVGHVGRHRTHARRASAGSNPAAPPVHAGRRRSLSRPGQRQDGRRSGGVGRGGARKPRLGRRRGHVQPRPGTEIVGDRRKTAHRDRRPARPGPLPVGRLAVLGRQVRRVPGRRPTGHARSSRGPDGAARGVVGRFGSAVAVRQSARQAAGLRAARRDRPGDDSPLARQGRSRRCPHRAGPGEPGAGRVSRGGRRVRGGQSTFVALSHGHVPGRTDQLAALPVRQENSRRRSGGARSAPRPRPTATGGEP